MAIVMVLFRRYQRVWPEIARKSKFRQFLYAHGIQIESRPFAFDAAHGGGGSSGEFIIACTALGLLAKQLVGLLTTYP